MRRQSLPEWTPNGAPKGGCFYAFLTDFRGLLISGPESLLAPYLHTTTLLSDLEKAESTVGDSTMELTLIGILVVALFGYLLFSVIWPEKF